MKKVEVFTPVNHARKHENEKFRWIALFLRLDQDKRAYGVLLDLHSTRVNIW